jgi:two-component system chemotaxis response regulator CheY
VRILIADDNASVRAAMRRVLESLGEDWVILDAQDGQEAIAKAWEFRPDLVILDLVMPTTDGLTASREIARLLPDVPILMHTLYSSLYVELEAAAAGVRRVVPKSESSVLISAVQEVLDSTPPAPAAASEPPAPNATPLRRRQEDKIRELSAQLFAMEDNKAHSPLLTELRDALHRHIEQLRARVADYPVVERRVRTVMLRPEPAIAQDMPAASSPASSSLPLPTIAEPPANSPVQKPSADGSH